MKEKACADVGIFSDEHKLSAETSENELLALIAKLNADPKIHGILVQLPLPKQINTEKVLEAISPDKDVDGFHPYNVGRLMVGKPTFQPCTPYGVMVMLKEIGFDLDRQKCCCRRPLEHRRQAGRHDVSAAACNRDDLPLQDEKPCRSRQGADVVIAAVGVPEMIKGDWIKEGAVVIDVGVNRVGEKKLVGDVELLRLPSGPAPSPLSPAESGR